jgi:ribonuclease HI
MKFYVVTEPHSIRGIYNSWPECEAAVSGVRGAIYQSVSSHAEAQALLSGKGLVLPEGVYAFVDGNHLGGVGIVFVKQRRIDAPVVKQLSTSVHKIFEEIRPHILDSRQAIDEALARLRNVLAELAGLYKALDHIAPKTELTIVYDYEGVGAWLSNRWKPRDSLIGEIISACRDLIANKSLVVHYHHQPGHHSSHAGRNDFASYNAVADSLATKGTGSSRHVWS